MNNFLQENLFAIILFLLLIILLLIGIIAFVVVKLLLSKTLHAQAPTPQTQRPERIVLTPTVESPLTKVRKLSEEHVSEKFFCENHPDVASVGSCLICEDVFCEKCLIEHENMYFCKEHFKTFANNKWKQITDVKTTPLTPEDGLFVYHFKRHLWKDKQTPSFVLTHYKINIEEDFIESFVQLNVLESDADQLSEDIERFRASH